MLKGGFILDDDSYASTAVKFVKALDLPTKGMHMREVNIFHLQQDPSNAFVYIHAAHPYRRKNRF